MGNVCISKINNIKTINKSVRRTNHININSINKLRNYWKNDTTYDISISDNENMKRVIHKLGI